MSCSDNCIFSRVRSSCQSFRKLAARPTDSLLEPFKRKWTVRQEPFKRQRRIIEEARSDGRAEGRLKTVG
ncbi:hypothetical protein Pcinc_044332 [Petrolisthes cinctipes]|uniref:Uncharacterized protein n=1 Tax=Petrolisthes cinctipes TaxID=88211 RepID=A0AAE1EFD8_PETCI|nr:hypothetical protein Pcinc_044332 [Petrolisthes cinctipes]